MRFMHSSAIRSVVARLIFNASLAFALATITGVTASQALAESDLTPQQLDQAYEQQENFLYKDVRPLIYFAGWKIREERYKTNVDGRTYSEDMQKLLDNPISIYSFEEKQRQIEDAIYIEKKYGHLSTKELKIEALRLLKQTCLNIISIAEKGGKKALSNVPGLERDCVDGGIYLKDEKDERLEEELEEFQVKQKVIAEQVIEGKWQVDPLILARAHLHLADLYSSKGANLVRRDKGKTKYHLEQAKEASGQACDAGLREGCRLYNNFDETTRAYLSRFDEKTSESNK